MTDHRTDDSQIEIQDLASQEVDIRDAEQVRGGFNPQPDPPKTGLPVLQPPVFNPGGFVRQ